MQYATAEALIWGALGSTWLSRASAWEMGTERTADEDVSLTEEPSRTVAPLPVYGDTDGLLYLHKFQRVTEETPSCERRVVQL